MTPLAEALVGAVYAAVFDPKSVGLTVNDPGEAAAVAVLDTLAANVERRSDNVPLSRDGRSVRRVGDLREMADHLRTVANDIRRGGQ